MGVVFEEATIRDSESYTLNEFRRRTGLGVAALRAARRRGLRVTRVGSRSYVRGKDWNRYLAQCAAVDGSSAKAKWPQ